MSENGFLSKEAEDTIGFLGDWMGDFAPILAKVEDLSLQEEISSHVMKLIKYVFEMGVEKNE